MAIVIGLCAAVLVLAAVPGAAGAAEPKLRKLTPVPFSDVKVEDGFWAPRIETNRTHTIPYDFKKCEETGRISNFEKAAGTKPGEFEGIFFNDSDLYKVIEGAAYSLAAHPDPVLEKYVDEVIAKIASAQQKDGYLYTFYTVRKELDKRWTREFEMHETYCAGHLIEAAVAHFRATGKRTLLDVAIKLADHIDSIFGPGKLMDVSGHEEIELALVKLYEVTGEERYLKRARFFIDERGNAKGHKLFGAYCQDQKPVVEQSEPTGHAVRAMYLYCGMSDVAALTGDAGYLGALDKIWDSMVNRRMFVTGGVGARHEGEAFGEDYELPNGTAYCETCAAIGLVLWSHRMNLLTADARYADVMERALYNGMLSGVSLDGEKFFYVNPLATEGKHHREPWFGCACCPVNVARLVPSVPGYVYATDADGITVNLYVAGKAKIARTGGAVALTQETRYPWDGNVKIAVEPESAGTFDMALRIPAWAVGDGGGNTLYHRLQDAAKKAFTLAVNGQVAASSKVEKGYARIRREWKKGDVIELSLPMPVDRVYAHWKVKADEGRVALQRGPIVYCLEGVDNGKGLAHVYLPLGVPIATEEKADLLGGVTVLKTKGLQRQAEGDPTPVDLVAIPYYAWDHRAAGPMEVWIPEKADVARPAMKPTIASEAKASASHQNPADSASALNDQIEPTNSGDLAVPRFTWWDHKGTKEWVQYDFAKPAKVSGVEVYWFDDTGKGECRVPKSWRVLQKKGDAWEPVAGASECGTARDQFNRATFAPVETGGLRLEVELQPNVSGGILEWRVVEGK